MAKVRVKRSNRVDDNDFGTAMKTCRLGIKMIRKVKKRLHADMKET